MTQHRHEPGSPSQAQQHSDHDDSKDDQPTSGLKKKRIQQACRSCGIKRVKCDGANPCVTCVRSGEVCEYGLPKKRGPPKGFTRGGSKAARRKAEAQTTPARKEVREAAAALPLQSTRDYAAASSAAVGSRSTNAALQRPPPPPFPEAEWSRAAAPAAFASASSSSHSKYPPHAGPSHRMPYASIPPPVSGMRPTGAFPPPDVHADSFSQSAHASPDSSYRTDSHRTTGSVHDGSVGSPNYGGINSSSPGYFPPHSYPSKYDPASASHGPHKPRAEPFYRGSSSGLGLIRPPAGASDRRLPPLDFYARPSIRSTPSSPSNFRRLSGTSDTYESAVSGRSSTNRSLNTFAGPYPRALPTASASAARHHPTNVADAPAPYDPASSFDNRSAHSSTAPTSHVAAAAGWPAAPHALPPQSDALSDAARADRDALGTPAGVVRQSHAGESNKLLLEGTLLQLQRDRDRDRYRALKSEHGASNSSAAANFGVPRDVPEDVNLEPLLWVEPGDASRQGVNRSGVSLTKPEIPPLIQERLFTIFWGIVQTIWPALYKPALNLTGFNVIDPDKSPMLHNAACALAAVAWDSGEFGVSDEDAEATQSDLVERTASDLSFSQGPDHLGDGTSLRRLSAADLGDVFLARAKYYLIKTNNEPSLETIQSLMFMALREGGNGRASQASAYISTACRMCIDLGLHRQRDFSSVLGLHFSHAEEQARRRIFWCLYLLDKTSSASLGRPVTLRYAEIDCPLPNLEEQDEHETWAESTNNSSLIKDRARSMLLKTRVAAMSHLRFGVRLGHICEQIIAIYTHVQRSGDEDDNASSIHRGGGEGEGDGDEQGADGAAVPEWETRLVRLHRKLEAWERDLPYRLRFDNPAHRLPSTLSQHLWFQACKVMLHRPYILKQSARPDLPPSHRICTEAVGSICDILTAYDNNFGMRKLSSTFTYCIFTASTIEIANTTSTDAAVALEAKRRLRKFMTWLSRMSGTWQSAGHHLKILEQLGHGIDADLDGTGLPSHRKSSAGSLAASRAHSPTAAAMAAATGAMAKSAGIDVAPSPLSLPKDARDLLVDGGALSGVGLDQQQQHLANAGGMPLAHSGLAEVGDDVTGLSVPGPIGAPMFLTRSLANYPMASTLQDDLHAQFQAHGHNPSVFYGWPSGTATAPRVDTSTSNANTGSVYDSTGASVAVVPAPTQQPIPGREASPHAPAAAVPNNATSTLTGSAVDPTAYLKLHDTSYWGAMPLASEDPLSWANFTSSYIEALNGMTHVSAPSGAIGDGVAFGATEPNGGRPHGALAAASTATSQS
ncbi:related to nitrogen assimilation transcription factor [Sporisorium reilianum f. sp. reilianum]|uniref:Related to nitrogen assimilation transcription factor n=1 Tax=Sporisorium reilianum f. sp. reilianum TaxID=72559 RepID=A0A2N8UFQ2_9BASI|nr:related to nitrogen assimilation transcription factor [Sporisorium reilianum f. sp. reilianum]